jgi:hypothetical protein
MPRHVTCLIAAAGVAALAYASPARAGFDDCDCAPPAGFALEREAEADVTPRYFVNRGPVYSGPNLTAPPLTYSDIPSAAEQGPFPYVRSFHGWYFVGGRY